ncbi:hypothetical protein DPMN_099216 [Dreissena polymorpha]|uniref:Uncharacterized protein n=1 Tax=Dreissena polymorpha TaxID=45954 RepID=A0A9D4LF28_DREPO|nr:hypothetical protein DPMN_099216 [Dreissena polymorpha]
MSNEFCCSQGMRLQLTHSLTHHILQDPREVLKRLNKALQHNTKQKLVLLTAIANKHSASKTCAHNNCSRISLVNNLYHPAKSIYYLKM